MMLPKTLHNRKSGWLRRLRRAECDVVDILARAYRHDKTLRPRHIGAVNARLVRLGEYGERLWADMGDIGVLSETLAKIGDTLSDIQDLSEGLTVASKRILGFEMRSLRPYYSTVVRGRIKTESAASKELDTFNEIEDDVILEEGDNE